MQPASLASGVPPLTAMLKLLLPFVALRTVVAGLGLGLRRHIVARHPVQPADGIMVPAELWDDARCRQLAGPAFDAIQHGPYKADLCRLYVLLQFGDPRCTFPVFTIARTTTPQ